MMTMEEFEKKWEYKKREEIGFGKHGDPYLYDLGESKYMDTSLLEEFLEDVPKSKVKRIVWRAQAGISDYYAWLWYWATDFIHAMEVGETEDGRYYFRSDISWTRPGEEEGCIPSVEYECFLPRYEDDYGRYRYDIALNLSFFSDLEEAIEEMVFMYNHHFCPIDHPISETYDPGVYRVFVDEVVRVYRKELQKDPSPGQLEGGVARMKEVMWEHTSAGTKVKLGRIDQESAFFVSSDLPFEEMQKGWLYPAKGYEYPGENEGEVKAEKLALFESFQEALTYMRHEIENLNRRESWTKEDQEKWKQIVRSVYEEYSEPIPNEYRW